MICIGIDPGTHTGVAVWDTREGKFLSLETLPIHRAMTFILKWSLKAEDTGQEIQVVFEDARQRTWFGHGDTDAKKQGAGSVKRDCSIWEDFCKDYDIPFKAHKPQAGGTKWDKEYWQKVTGWTGRSSEHSRDAALLVWGMR